MATPKVEDSMRTYPMTLPVEFGSDPALAGMKLWLPINEGAGSRFNNLIDSQNPGIMAGGTWSGGKPALDGTDDLITLRRVPIEDFTTIIHYTPTGVSGISTIFDQGDILIRQSGSNVIYGATDTNNTDSTDTLTAALTAGQPIAIAVTRSGDTMTIWGFTKAGVVTDSFTVSGTPLTSNENLIIGSDSRESFVFPALTPANLTAEKAIVINANDRLEIPTGSPSLNSINSENWNKDQFTILMWLNLNFDAGSGGENYLVSNQGTSNTNNRYYLYISPSGTIVFGAYDKDSTGHTLTYSASVAGWLAGEWHQIVCILDFPNDTGGLYTDGALRDNTFDNALSSDSITVIEANTHIGSSSAGDNQLNGSLTFLAESRSWTNQQILDNWNGGAGIPFVVSESTLALGNYSDGETSITYHHTGYFVTNTVNTANETAITISGTSGDNVKDGDDMVLQDATGYSVPVVAKGDWGAGGGDVDDGAGNVVSGIEEVGVFAQLNGSSHSFVVSDATFPDTGLTGAQDLTIYVWIKPGDISTPDVQILVSKWDWQSNDRMYELIQNYNELRFDISSDGFNHSFKVTTMVNLVVGEWAHVAVAYDASAGTADFYKDGIFIEQGSGMFNTIADKPADFNIGVSEGGAFYCGSLGPVHLFSDIRTAAEILFDATNPGADLSAEGNLVCGYTFRDATGVTQIDNVTGDASGDLNLVGGDTTNFGTHTRTQEAHISRNLIIDIEDGGIGGYTIVGTPTLVDKEGDTDSDSLSLHIVSAADDDGVAITIQASNGEKFYLAQRHKVTAGSFEVNVTNGGGGIETGIADADWTALELIISATDTLTFQWLGEGAGDDFNISKASILQCVAGDSLEADKYYTLVYNVDTTTTGAAWSGLGSDAVDVKSGDLYVRDDTADASTADRLRSFADGKVESVAVWDRAMTFEEVQQRKDEI